MQHQQYTAYIRKEVNFLKLLVNRIHEQDSLSAVELDITLAKTQNIYEQLLKLKLIHQHLASQTMPPGANDIAPSMGAATAFAPQPEFDAAPSYQPQPPEPVSVAASQYAAPAYSAPAGKQEQMTLADKIRPATNYSPINESLAQKNMPDLAGKLQSKPLRHIADGIGVNDRFLYLRELFANDKACYNETLRLLDAAQSLDDALYAIQPFNWDANDHTVQQFLALIYRKHPQ